jgi:exo-beta-1,3-glucanase (GH17 family)
MPSFFMTDETKNTEIQVPDMTDTDEVRKVIIANEILNRKY